MSTDSVSTAKCTNVRRLNSKIGSRAVAVLLVLPARILDPLARERVLQLHRCHGNTVQAQRDIQRLLGAWREVELAGKPKRFAA